MTRDGALLTVENKPALRFERRYPHPIERVWHAITDPDELGSWFPSHVIGDRSVGAELVFADDAQRAAAREAGEPTRDDGPLVRGTVLAHEPPRLFSFTWGGEVLRFELTPDGAGTRLVFTQLLSHQTVAARNGAGWHQCLGGLDRVLGVESPNEGGGWEAVYHDFLDRMGPALGVRSGRGAVTWERSTHVPPERVREVTSAPEELDAWGAAGHADEPLRWEVHGTEHGTCFRLTHDGVGHDAHLAATWHALLVQLDMYLAAGQLVPVDPGRWVAAYESLLGAPA